MAAVARTVVVEARAQAVIDAAIEEIPQLEDLYRGLEWRVCRDPRAGYQIPKTNPPAFLIRSKEWTMKRSFVLLYHWDADTVTVIAARVRNSEEVEVDEATEAQRLA